MKKHSFSFLLALILLLTSLDNADAQKKYTVKIKQNNGKEIKGDLQYAMGDSIGVLEKHGGNLRLKVTEILSIKIHRKNGAGRGAAIGAGTGAVIGALIGVASYEPPHCPHGSFCFFQATPGDYALSGAFVFMVAGALVGSVVGATSKEIKINNAPSQFDVFKNQYGLLSPVQKVSAPSN